MAPHPLERPVSPAAARAALHRIIEQLTDAEVTGLWQLFCNWGAARGPTSDSQERSDRSSSHTHAPRKESSDAG
jgi:hypothetical protein